MPPVLNKHFSEHYLKAKLHINWLCDAVTLERNSELYLTSIDKNSEHFNKRMNPKIYKHFGGTITPCQEHKSSQAFVVCNFQLLQCSFGTIKPHRAQ